MKKRKQRKLKKKGILYLIITIGLIVALSVGLFFYSIKLHYHPYVITTKLTKLYNQKGKVVGSIAKGCPLTLDKRTGFSKYFQIQNTSYYIYHKDIKEGKKVEKEPLSNHQIALNKTITSKKEMTLYKGEKKQITLLKGGSFPVIYEDSTDYFISFQAQILRLPKTKLIEEEKKEEETNPISVLFFENIADTCYDSNCTTTIQFKNNISELLKNGYYTITEKDLANYLEGYAQFQPKAVLITTSTNLENLKGILEEYKITISNNTEEGLKYYSTNQTNTTKNIKLGVNRYQIKTNDSTEKVLNMAAGVPMPIEIDNHGIAVINYHFFYDPSINEVCNETICLKVQKLREHLEYLKNNHFQTLTMEEFKRWMYGEIDLPTKSVLLTIDDGAMGTGAHNGNKLIPLLEEYKMHATLFLITGWWNVENYLSPYLDIQSHTYDMHQYGPCGRGQINCATYEQAKEDLEKSLAILGNKDSFCFPFYMYSDTSLKAVKDVGFQLAFVGGNRKATRSSNKWLIPRYPIHSDITLERFIQIVN